MAPKSSTPLVGSPLPACHVAQHSASGPPDHNNAHNSQGVQRPAAAACILPSVTPCAKHARLAHTHISLATPPHPSGLMTRVLKKDAKGDVEAELKAIAAMLPLVRIYGCLSCRAAREGGVLTACCGRMELC